MDARLAEQILMTLFQADCMSGEHILRREYNASREFIPSSDRPITAFCYPIKGSSNFKCSIGFEVGFRDFFIDLTNGRLFSVRRIYMMQDKNDSMEEVIDNSSDEAMSIFFALSEQNTIVAPLSIVFPRSTIPANGCKLRANIIYSMFRGDEKITL